MKINSASHLFLLGVCKYIKLLIPVYLLFSLNSCEEPDTIGVDLVEDPANISSSDINVVAYSVSGDSVFTNYSSRNLLGFRNDPVFGSTHAGIFAELRLEDENLDLENDINLDSVVLKLYYTEDGYYGNYNTPQNIKIYELAENFPESEDGNQALYYSTLELDHKPSSIVDTVINFAPNDSVMVDTSMQKPHLRLKLSGEFGQKLISGIGTDHFENNDAFIEYIKGLYITVDALPENEDGAIFSFNLVNPETNISQSMVKLYYHEPDNNNNSKSLSFPVNENKRSTYVEHSYENAHDLLRKQLIENDTAHGDSLLFIQALGGSNININFLNNSLDSLNEKNVIINMANLIIPIEEHFYSADLPPPNKLFLLAKDEEGSLMHIIDNNYRYYGGDYDEENKEYSINITQHFQSLIDNPASNYGHALLFLDSHSKANRVVLKGPGQSDNNLRLELNYSIFD